MYLTTRSSIKSPDEDYQKISDVFDNTDEHSSTEW